VNEVVRFLTAFTQALTQMMRLDARDPARRRAIDTAYGFLLLLHETRARVRFTFAGPHVRFGDAPVRELHEWEWAPRLTDAGVHWLEADRGARPAEFEALLTAIVMRMTFLAGDVSTEPTRVGAALRFGVLEADPDAALAPASAAVTYPLREEVAAVQWAFDAASIGTPLPVAELEIVVRSLGVALHADETRQIPVLSVGELVPGQVAHALNTAGLTMALAEWMALPVREARALGLAALLHDIGMALIPAELLATPGGLDDEARARVRRHPHDGARYLAAVDRDLDLAVTVAYEHHRQVDGGGYPDAPPVGRPHRASQIVQVCSVYDAMRSSRPHRPALDAPAALTAIETGAGTVYDGTVAGAFVAMWRTADLRIVAADAALELPLMAALSATR
jgi:putative two-component system response regulator